MDISARRLLARSALIGACREASRNADWAALWRQYDAADWAQMKIRMGEATNAASYTTPWDTIQATDVAFATTSAAGLQPPLCESDSSIPAFSQ
ncbi:hypothetical protein EH240_31890 [Mesorhizobium tamadayense]|uniref:Uncharacterized protein n=1 Tax=Mesorhizobium tamadayense TaxID=425306 RepID=A0A3P3EZK6_9HYPH|nr:hypothetical protein [Mesorhizobium tamadayense]RRH91823.1 hypothetical protein EH240_31890 [Mesorhizobium tamadayense]